MNAASRLKFFILCKTMKKIPAHLLVKILNCIKFKHIVAKSFNRPPRKPLSIPYCRLQKSFSLSDFSVENGRVITLTPLQNASNKHILFFHGGAYVLQGSAMHWNLIKTIGQQANCVVSFIDYPLVPENTFRETFEMVQLSYNLLVDKFPQHTFMFMGDSAGGGLALAFAQKLFNEKTLKLPSKVILFSPWLDISLGNEEIQNHLKSDPILPFNALLEVGKKYTAGSSAANYLVSPIFGNLEEMCPTKVFYGSNELFYPDCEKLRKMTQHHPKFSFELFPNMPHDWVILPVPEADVAINIAIDFIHN